MVITSNINSKAHGSLVCRVVKVILFGEYTVAILCRLTLQLRQQALIEICKKK